MKTPVDFVAAFRLRTVPAALALAACLLLALAAPAFAATYDPLDVIPYDTFHASSSMTAADIQTFLDKQTGPLGSLVARDYLEVKKPVSQIIYEAAHAWNLNPKVILATLQKEQSLLTLTGLSSSQYSAVYKKAMGCGVYGAIDPATGLTTNRYPGFGNQVWNATRLLSTYETTKGWVPGKAKTVTVSSTGATMDIVPANASTFALYTYTPYYPQKLVWDVYVKNFGDPHAASVVPTTLVQKVGDTTLKVGKYVTVSSVLKPAVPAGTHVRYQARFPGSSAYVTLSSTRDVSSSGASSIRYKLLKKGTYYFRARFMGISGFTGSISNVSKVVVN